MELKSTTTIDAPINEVWALVAGDFANASNWMSIVPVSYPIPDKSADGSQIPGRICELTNKGAKGIIAEEKIISCDNKTHRLVVDVTPKNTPPGFPVKSSQTVFSLETLPFNQTRVNITAMPRLNVLGSVLNPSSALFR